MNFLKQYPRKRIELSVIEQHYELFHYQDLYLFIQNAQECGLLKPVQSSGSNGKKPALYKKYHIKNKHRGRRRTKRRTFVSVTSDVKK